MIWAFALKNWRIFAIGGALLAIFFAFRWWLVAHDEKIYQEGRISGTAEMAKAKQAEWKAKEDALAKAQEDIDLTRSQIDSEMTALTRTRQMTRAELDKLIAAIRTGREVSDATARTIPASDLDAALRTLSAELAAVK